MSLETDPVVEVVADQADTILLGVQGTLAELAVRRVVRVLHRDRIIYRRISSQGEGEGEGEGGGKEKEKEKEKEEHLQPCEI